MASVTKRGNTYTIRVSLGYDLTGKQVQKFTTWKPAEGMTEKQIAKELERQKIMFEEKCRSGRVLDSTITFAEFSEYWMKEYAEKKLRPSTVEGYKLKLKRILPAIGHIKLEKLQPHHLMELYSNLQESGIRTNVKRVPVVDLTEYLKEIGTTQIALSEKAGVSIKTVYAAVHGNAISDKSAHQIANALCREVNDIFTYAEGTAKALSNKTVLNHHRLISSILEKAVKWQILFSNPCERVEAPKIERKEARYLDEKQAAELLNYLQAESLKYRTIITLLLYSGMRRGELCGLEWADIDFENSIIDINKSSLYLSSKGIFDDDTKTQASHRVIKLPPVAMQLLSDYQIEQRYEAFALGDKWENSGKVFTQWNGKPIHPDTVTGWFSKFIKKNNLPDVSIHSLRHTNATLLIASGTDLRTVSKRLGHSNMTTTGNIYTHAIQTADERAAAVLGDILTPKTAEGTKHA